MSEKQHSKRRRSDKSRDKSSSWRMEDDLNRSSFRSGDAAGRPPPEKVPRTTGADPYVPPRGNEPYFYREASAQPQAGNETVLPLVGNETGQVAPTRIPPQEGIAAPVNDVPAGQLFDGSYADSRGADPTGYEHGADYRGYLATGFNSSLVNDDEAASRAEYRYQQVQEHALRTPAYGDPYGRPRPNAQSTSLRTSFDS
jgi:hypothetical protein